jgi:hypothetical protein
MMSLIHHIVGASRLLVGMSDDTSSITHDDEGGDDDHHGGDGSTFDLVPPLSPPSGDVNASSSVPPPRPLGADVDQSVGDHGDVVNTYSSTTCFT